MIDHNREMSKPSLSAIIITNGPYDNVRRSLGYLKAQTLANEMEVIMVTSTPDQLKPEESELNCFHSWHIVDIDEITSIGQGYMAGIKQAQSTIIALSQDHAFPDSRWAELFIRAHQQPWAAVGPKMSNGNPDSMISWADFYISYGEWAHPLSSGSVRHLPGHNSSYKRDILTEFSAELEELLEAESILHRRLKSRGYELFLESGTCTQHINYTTWRSWLQKRYYQGRQFMSTWAKSWSWPRRLLMIFATPLIACLRLWRLLRHIGRGKGFVFFLYLIPALVAGLMAEGAGQALGCAAGRGNYSRKLIKYEFDRLKHAGLL